MFMEFCFCSSIAGVGGAEKGTLTFMVGCSSDLFPRVQQQLGPMGSNVVRCGEVGAGQVRWWERAQCRW